MLTRIFFQLKQKNIQVDATSLKKHSCQGLMSRVYVVDSNQGNLIIHVIKPVQEWIRQKIWQKLLAIANLLSAFPDLPTARFFLAGKIKSRYFLVQEKLPGRVAGRRLLNKSKVKDIWPRKNKDAYWRDLQRIIAGVHKIKRRGYGWPIVKNSELVGQYSSWPLFFKREMPAWLKSVAQGNRRLGMSSQNIKTELLEVKKLANQIIKKISSSESVLVHGDAVNPGNILIEKGKISGILDWEWALIGDPAWEFCDPGWWPFLNEKSLATYFQELNYNQSQVKDFLRRARDYRLLWILWGAHMHAGDKNIRVFRVLSRMLQEEVAYLKKWL